MKIERKNLREYRDRINAALSAEFENEGFTIEAGHISYSSDQFTCKVEFDTVSSEDRERDEFESWAPLFDLTADDYRRVFQANGAQYRLTGFSSRSPKFCILGERVSDGKKFKFTRDVLRQLAKAGGDV